MRPRASFDVIVSIALFSLGSFGCIEIGSSKFELDTDSVAGQSEVGAEAGTEIDPNASPSDTNVPVDETESPVEPLNYAFDQPRGVAGDRVAVDYVHPPSDQYRVVVLSDMNGSYGSTSYSQSVDEAVTSTILIEPDVVLSAGDMVAGQQAGLDYEAMWAAFHDTVTDPLTAAGIPFAVTPGNHDASGYSGYAGERTIYQQQWLQRTPDIEFLDDRYYPFMYSFVVGPALFISLDATLVGPLDQEQFDWVDEQLEAGADFPVKIVYGHVPIHPFAEGRESEILADRELENLLVDSGVSLFISGHHHAYYPGQHDELRVASTACLGSGPRALLGDEGRSERSILVIEFDQYGLTNLDALGGPAFNQVIERETLPSAVGNSEYMIIRDDLAGGD